MKRHAFVAGALFFVAPVLMAQTTPPPAAPTAAGAKAPAKAAAPEEEEEYVVTGLGNRFVQSYTPLVNKKGLFEAAVTHRFYQPAREAGGGGALGLDGGNSFGLFLEYAFLKNVAVQIARSDANADYEFAAKVTLLRPSKSLPLAIGLRGGLDWQTANYLGPNKKSGFFGQALVSITIADVITLAAAPTIVEKTPGGGGSDGNSSVFNVPIIAQIKITSSIAAIGEYVPAKTSRVPGTVGQWSFAIEKSVYHHKFALRFGNSGAVTTDQIMAGDWQGGVTESNIRLGFNLTRQFDIGN